MWLLHVLLATTLLILSAANLRVAEAFVTTPALAASRAPQIALASFTLSLQAKQSKKEEDEEDEDDDEDDAMTASLGDWRSFRASLISKSSSSNNSGGEPNQPTTSVAQENEALLEQQNQALAQEYKRGVWAHTIQWPEVGGLLARMPLEAELYNGPSGGYWKDKLTLMLSMEPSSSSSSSSSTSSSGSSKALEGQDDADLVTVQKVDQWFQMAEKLVETELLAITQSGKIQNGILNPSDLGDNERRLLDKYMEYKKTWQEICLVLEHSPTTGRSQAVILNRPITKQINKPLATLLLEGSSGKGKGNFDYAFGDQLVQAFGTQAAVYMGGPDGQDEPALLLHGISDLKGAREIAPGTHIYQGGWEAAVKGVLEGVYRPLDFRFFLGRQSYDPAAHPDRGALQQKVQDGAYQPVACARSLALKQCLGLPKPLWHEVLELCGGELKALSTIELRKRIDLQ